LFLEYNYFNNLLHLCFCYSLMDYKYISSPAILSHWMGWRYGNCRRWHTPVLL